MFAVGFHCGCSGALKRICKHATCRQTHKNVDLKKINVKEKGGKRCVNDKKEPRRSFSSGRLPLMYGAPSCLVQIGTDQQTLINHCVNILLLFYSITAPATNYSSSVTRKKKKKKEKSSTTTGGKPAFKRRLSCGGSDSKWHK